MNILLKVLGFIIPVLEIGNLLKGGQLLSTVDFTVIATTVTIISIIKTIKISEKISGIIGGGWIIFLIMYFALGIGFEFFYKVSYIANTLNLIWFYIGINVNIKNKIDK
ncbi:hypothetical protein [uncultured Clostridium sp.]|uniref:hypothetical protein n=1 Tax=uncultured Clostridium sp. TaxID=59620 RepID=UPI0025CBFB9D|nr:hypothetical protein [uncultured Clostridium sp.]